MTLPFPTAYVSFSFTLLKDIMEQKTRGIVLRIVKYADNKIIVDFLTREEGRLSVACKVSSSSRSRIRRQLFQPLSILDIDYSRSPRQQLATLTDARLATVYSSLPFDGVKLSLAFFVAEFLAYATRDMHSDAVLYGFVEQSLLWLDASDRGLANFHLMFMMRMSRFLGFYPDVETYEEGALFDLREGAFVQHVPLHTDYLRADDARRMLLLMRMSPFNLHLFRMSRAERNHAVDICLQFYRLHIPAFGEMKTLPVLRDL